MTEINRLNRAAELESGDLIPIWDADDGATRAVSAGVAAKYFSDAVSEEVMTDITAYNGTISEHPAWADVPKHGDPDFGDALDAQPSALAARTEYLRSQSLSVKDPEFAGGAVLDGVADDAAAFIAAGATGRPILVNGPSVYLSANATGNFYSEETVVINGPGDAYIRNMAARTDRVRRTNNSVMRWHGNAGGSIGVTTEDVTYTLKMEAETEFDSVALMWVNYEVSPLPNCTAVVAATDTFNMGTQDTRYRPMSNGVVKNTLRGPTDFYGWDTVTWDGVSSVTVPAGAGAAAPGVVVSDFMPIVSLPRTDGGTRPLVLMRYRPPTATPFNFEQLNYSSWRTASANNRGRLFDVGQFTGDAIGNLNNSMIQGIRTTFVSPIFRFRRNVVSVAAVGDSITMGVGSASGLDSWNRRACYDLSTPDRPVVPSNCGLASQTSATYLGFGKKVLAASKPTVCFYFPYSPNDNVASTRARFDEMARAADFVDFCTENGIIPILCTPVPATNKTAANDAIRVQVANDILAMGASGSVIVADMRAATTGAVVGGVEQWLPGLNSDQLHPSDAGHDAMAVAARKAIQRAIYG